MSPQELEKIARAAQLEVYAALANKEAALIIERDLKKSNVVPDGDDKMDFFLSRAGICPYW